MPRNTATKQPITKDEIVLATILLVDDLVSDIELTQELLHRAKLKCNLLIARDGAEAHRILKQGACEGSKIDLVLLDINMPGMDGFELLDRIRKDTALKDIAVVMCSGSLYEQDKHRAEALNAVGYLEKPLSMDKFKSAIERITALSLRRDGDAEKLIRLA